MASKSINIVLNLSLDGTILNFSVQSSENRKEWMEVLSDSDSPEHCPLCSCQISVFTRLAIPKLKTEALSEKEDLPDDFQHHEFETKVEDLISSDEDEKPIVEFIPTMDEGPKIEGNVVSKRNKHRNNVSPVRCLHCKKLFQNEYLIEMHLKRYGIENTPTEPVPDAVKCTDHCNRYFVNEDELLKHVKQSTSRKAIVAPLRCLHCQRLFQNEYLLGIHFKRYGIENAETEPVPDAIKCTHHCNRYFASRKEVLDHLKKVKIVSYSCDECSKDFAVRKDYLAHLLTHGPLACRKCDLSFTDRQSYNKHQRTHFRRTKHRCGICSLSLETEAHLNAHNRFLHENNRSCTFCGETFKKWMTLLEHENKHQNITPHQCHVCGMSFYRKLSFNDHMLKHQGRVYICHFCEKSYKTRSNLRTHILGLHLELHEIFVCTICPRRKRKPFRTEVEYRSHMKRHNKKAPCLMCGKTFLSESVLKKHIQQAHSSLSERPKFPCEVCGKLLLSKSNLKSHLNTHKEATEFKCKYCSKSMANANNLQRHEMIHTDERPFTCQTCGKGFRTAVDLKTHTRLHTGEKPYECPLEECKKRFSDRGCFRGHLINHEKQLNIKLVKRKYDYDTMTQN